RQTPILTRFIEIDGATRCRDNDILSGHEEDLRMRNVCLVLLMALAARSVAVAQTPLDPALEARLKKAFPDATSFSPKQTTPLPHFIAYTGSGASRTIAGYVFWTTEIEPLERGYDGPIKMLVGLDIKGYLTGVLVVEHHEPY